MILAIFICGILHSSDLVAVENVSPTEVQMQVQFDAFHRENNLPITRFIISITPPVCTYAITAADSHDESHVTDKVADKAVTVGRPISIKGLNAYPVTIYPVCVHNNMTTFIHSLNTDIEYTPVHRQPHFSASMHEVFKDLILNYRYRGVLVPQGYLIIVPDVLYNDVLPLAQWKEKKGWYVKVATLSQTGSNPTDIRNYIANEYYTNPHPPEYVLLIGDINYISAYSSAIPVSTTDYPYTLIEGDDFLAELFIGRLPAANATELETMIAKIIGYETDPDMSSTAWFGRALMVAANYPYGQMTTPIPTKKLIRERMYEYGFSTVDTVFHPPSPGGAEISNYIDQGVLFVNYRGGDADPDGWIHPDYHNTDVTGLSNGWKLPVVTSIVCLNGNFGYGTCFGEAWLRTGNAINPRGAVSFFGASAATTSSRWNNCLDYGIFWGMLKENIYNFAPAMYRGKMEIYGNFPGDTSWNNGSSFYFHTYNNLGDPSLDMWTGIPDTFVVSHSLTGPVGMTTLSVQVLNSTSQPVLNALVSLYKNNEVKEVMHTDQSGSAQFAFTTASPGTLFVTVSKHNIKPYCGLCLIGNTAVHVAYAGHTISDSGGNNNGEINPGEPIELQITLQNYGTSTTATNVSAKLSTPDALIVVTDSIKNFSDIGPGGTASAGPYAFNVSNQAQHNHVIPFELAISSSQGNWTSGLHLDVMAPRCVFQRCQILDANNTLEPGETSDMVVSIENIGGLAGSNINGILHSTNPGVIVVDSIGSFGTIAVNDSATNNADRFTVSAASSITPGHKIRFYCVLSGDNSFTDTTGMFSIYIGVENQNTVLGSDRYGYFAYDNTDTGYPEHPTYSWIEIDPELGGPGDSISLQNDETKTASLPFNFKYYGTWYDRVSICSNGYIAMDSTWVADMYNWHIMSAGGPPLLIAPFWDDLDPCMTDSSGHVCYWHDAANHCFVIEYSRVQHVHDPTNPTPGELQTFEVILYDPQYYSTLTGDGEIHFQYNAITNDDIWHNYATVGIENYDHSDGLEYTFANEYPAAAAFLADNRAIKFTTDPPDTFPGIQEYEQSSGSRPLLTICPNPTQHVVHIHLSEALSTQGMALNIFDTSGRLIRNLQLPAVNSPVPVQIPWDCTDNDGERVSSGIYFVHLVDKKTTTIKKVVIID
jgi:hypothetical protein